MKRIVVLVSGGGTNLQALLDAQDRGEIPGGQITCVIASKPGVYALERAAAHGISGKVLERKAYPDVHAYSAAMRDLLLAEQADLVVYAGFLTILDEQVVDAFPGKMMNIHPALIPSFCGKGYYGLHVHEAVLQSGVKLTGATVHYVNEIPDGGEIIMQKAVAVRRNDTPETLQQRVMRMAEWKIYPPSVERVCLHILQETGRPDRTNEGEQSDERI